MIIRLFLSAPFSVYNLLTRSNNEYLNYKSVLFSINHTNVMYNEHEIQSIIQGIRWCAPPLTDSQLSPREMSLNLCIKKVCFQQGFNLIKGMGVMNIIMRWWFIPKDRGNYGKSFIAILWSLPICNFYLCLSCCMSDIFRIIISMYLFYVMCDVYE